MVIRLLSIGVILVLCISSWGWASVPEEAADLTFILRANPIQVSHQNQETIPFNPRESTPTRLFSTGLIRLYQKYISTQDQPVCKLLAELLPIRDGSNPKIRLLSWYTVNR